MYFISNSGQLAFNIFLCDLFYFMDVAEIASYSDDTVTNSINEINKLVINDLL